MRILNQDALRSHGNVAGRTALVEILEAGLCAADPYNNIHRLLRREGNRLIVGCRDFEPKGDPASGDEIVDLDAVGRIFVFGAGKGVQRLAKAIEDILGDRLTGGHVIAKHGDDVICTRIGVTHGAHPVPDEGCALGCRRILAMCRGLTADDLVFTLGTNGFSALLTLPTDGISMDEVRQLTYMMQIERGVPTGDLNPIRNHMDQMKGGRFARAIQPARAIHIVGIDPSSYQQVIYRNLWLHSLPDCTTFADAKAMLLKWDAWDAAPAAVRAHITRADPADETVKADEFLKTRFRIFGTMPYNQSMIPTAQKKAAELGFKPLWLALDLRAEAKDAAHVMASVAKSIETLGQPVEPPCALFTTGELLVTVGQEHGMGGRNQEYCVSAALDIAGSSNILMASADSDGTDGPGIQFSDARLGTSGVTCLNGGIVDGETAREAKDRGVDLVAALKRHNTSPALYALDSGIVATQNISIGDFGVTLVLGRRPGAWSVR
jgi:glycerate-2-kinase